MNSNVYKYKSYTAFSEFEIYEKINYGILVCYIWGINQGIICKIDDPLFSLLHKYANQACINIL